jgi:hypothetical protein
MIFIILAVIIVIFVIVVLMRPTDFRVTRSAAISASPDAIFPHVNDLHKFQDWSPWAKADPAAKNTFEGPAAGKGAIFRWAGNKVGAGSMTLTESQPNDLVRFQLDFLKPFKGTNMVDFTFKPEGDKTVVTWSMVGANNFVTKAVGLFIDCEKMCGSQFEKGLADLKGIAEAEVQKVTP